MRESLFETLIGFLVVAVAGIFLVFSLQQRSDASPGKDSYELSARFNRIDGISTGSDVRMAGVKVGTVSAISLDPKTYKAIVTFTMKKGIEVPDDSTAQVLSENLLGGAYIGIMVGGAVEYIPEGGMIEFTRGSVDLLTVLSEVASSAANGNSNGNSGGGDHEEAPQ